MKCIERVQGDGVTMRTVFTIFGHFGQGFAMDLGFFLTFWAWVGPTETSHGGQEKRSEPGCWVRFMCWYTFASLHDSCPFASFDSCLLERRCPAALSGCWALDTCHCISDEKKLFWLQRARHDPPGAACFELDLGQ